MQVIYSDKPDNGRRHRTIGRIKAVGPWRGAIAVTESDRLAAVKALIEEAEGYDADALLGVRFTLDSVQGADIDGTPLRRIAATGVAIRFDEAA